ncbi:MAG: flagellar motor switch phosphatase FliY [Thermacetogeniaceae bacterium]
MNDNILSQEEIDLLLRGESSSLPNIKELTDLEKDAIGEICNISMGSAATALSSLLGKKVEITTPRVKVTTRSEFQLEYPLPYVIVNVKYTSGFVGENLFVIKQSDAAVIVDLMMGGDGSNPPSELNELHLSAISEAMNQMMGSAATAMSTIFNKKINISPPSLKLVNLAEEQIDSLEKEDDRLVLVTFKMFIEGLVDSEMMQLLPFSFAQEISRGLLGQLEESASPEQQTPTVTTAETKAEEQTVKKSSQQAIYRDEGVAVQPAQFMPFEPPTAPPKDTANLSLILDVSLQFSVELGRTYKTIKEILELGPGSIVELDKLAGEPVDVLVNGKPIAKGEVVVIDENYGVRITEILSSKERIDRINQ